MRKICKKEIIEMDRFTRANLLTSLSGIKSAMLVSTLSKTNVSNVAIFSSVVHLGSNPGLIGILIRPQTKRVSDTYQNIKYNNTFTINHINKDIIKKAHYTSAKTPSNTSEFDDVGLQEEYIDGFKSPFVKESDIGLGLIYSDEILLSNDCILMIGEIDNIKLNNNLSIENGLIDFSKSCSVGVDGISHYYELNLIEKHDYIGTGKFPNKI